MKTDYMKTDYKFSELVKMIKKHYVDSLSNDILDMQREIERLRTEVMDLKARNESLKKTIENDKFNVENDPSYVLGKAVAKYVKDTIKTDVMKNLNVEVDSEWDPYSGQRDHNHTTEISWNEDE